MGNNLKIDCDYGCEGLYYLIDCLYLCLMVNITKTLPNTGRVLFD